MFIGCFSNADDAGRLLGNAAYLRSTIFPYDDLSIEDVTAMRDEITTACKNLVYYIVDGIEYLAFKKWSQYQKPKYPKPSNLPALPNETISGVGTSFGDVPLKTEKPLPNVSPKLEKASPIGLGRDIDRVKDREGLGEGTGGPNSTSDTAPPDSTPTELTMLNALKSVPDYPFDYERDLEHIRALAVDYPTLDLANEIKKWRTYKLDKPLKPKSNPRSQLRNWCEKAVEYSRSRASPHKPQTDADPWEGDKYAHLVRT